MRRLVIVVEYLGKNYQGWQAQQHKNTICDVLTEAMQKVLCHDVMLFVSGRTDLGVNALRQYAHFDTDSTISTMGLCMGVNTKLPPDISVKECYEVPSDFDARFSVEAKTYLYKIYISPTPSPMRHFTHAQLYFPLDIEKMKQASQYIIGEHDFKAFMARGGHAKTTVRTVYDIDIKQVDDEVHFEVTGNGFLYNMVRIIVGTLVKVGQGKIPPQQVKEMIEQKRRALGGKTMEPQGLYLKSVKYQQKFLQYLQPVKKDKKG